MRRPVVVEKKLGRERADGQYWSGLALIQVDPRLRQDRRLRVVAHEAIHHALPDASERQVHAAARAVAVALWRDKWRRPHRSAP